MIQSKPKHLFVLTTAFGAVAFCSSAAPQVQQKPATGSQPKLVFGKYHLERKLVGHLRVEHLGAIKSGDGFAWTSTPKPPSYAAQEVASSILYVDGKPSQETTCPEGAQFPTTYLKVEGQVHPGSNLKLVVEGNWYKVKLVSGPGTEPGPVLSDEEKTWYLRSTARIKYDSDTFHQWVTDRIQRKTGEDDVHLMQRLRVMVSGYFNYANFTGPNACPDDLGEIVKEKHTLNCVKASDVLVGCARSLGIPARIISGMILSGFNHTRAQFFVDGVGWVTTEAWDTDRSDLGHDKGDMLIMAEDADLQFPWPNHRPCNAGVGSRIVTLFPDGKISDFATDEAPIVTKLAN